jgi:hypothetical protein
VDSYRYPLGLPIQAASSPAPSEASARYTAKSFTGSNWDPAHELRLIHEAMQIRTMVSAAEIPRDQQFVPRPVDTDEVGPIVHKLLQIDPRLPTKQAHDVAHILLSSGKLHCADLDKAECIGVESIWRVLIIPFAGEEMSPHGSSPDSTGQTWDYVWAHGTSPDTCIRILADGMVRPSGYHPQSQYDFPTFGFFAQGTPGSLNMSTIDTVSAKLLKIPKGQQGAVLYGTTKSMNQHVKLAQRDTNAEQRAVSRRGIVATSERWCFHASHSQIQAIGFPRCS